LTSVASKGWAKFLLEEFVRLGVRAGLRAGVRAAIEDPEPRPTPEWVQPGALASVVTPEGSYGVVKILARDAGRIHVRLYRQRFEVRPESIRKEELSLGTGEPCSAGHLPLSHTTFSDWWAQLLATTTVADEGLEGYRIWNRNQGGWS
jgi:hypothetical protein